MILGRFEERWISNLIPKKKIKKRHLGEFLAFVVIFFAIKNNDCIQILGIVGVGVWEFRQKIENLTSRLGVKP